MSSPLLRRALAASASSSLRPHSPSISLLPAIHVARRRKSTKLSDLPSARRTTAALPDELRALDEEGKPLEPLRQYLEGGLGKVKRGKAERRVVKGEEKGKGKGKKGKGKGKGKKAKAEVEEKEEEGLEETKNEPPPSRFPPRGPPPPGYDPESPTHRSEMLDTIVEAIQHWPDALVLTRVGSFYEAYFHQAHELSRMLSFAMARKSHSEPPIMMAGFPHGQLAKHVRTLVLEHKRQVAIIDQFDNEVPGKIVRRVVRVVSPGTLIDEVGLDPFSNNFLLALSPSPTDSDPSALGLAWTDVSTGETFTEHGTLARLPDFLARITPREIVLPSTLQPTSASDPAQPLLAFLNTSTATADTVALFFASPTPSSSSSSTTSASASSVSSDDDSAESLAITPSEHSALALLQARVRDAILEHPPEVAPAPKAAESARLELDAQTIRGLELRQTMREGRAAGSLMSAVRRTATRAGARLFADWLCAPSAHLPTIASRHAIVAALHARPHLRQDLRDVLSAMDDGPRVLQRFLSGRGKAGTLLQLKNVMLRTEEVVVRLWEEMDLDSRSEAQGGWKDLTELLGRFRDVGGLAKKIEGSVVEEVLQRKEMEQERLAEEAEAASASAVEDGSEEGEEEDEPRTASPKKKSAAKKKEEGAGDPKWLDDYERSIRSDHSPSFAALHAELDALYAQRGELLASLTKKLVPPHLRTKRHIGLRSTARLGHHVHVPRDSDFAAIKDDPQWRLVSSTGSGSNYAASYYVPAWFELKKQIVALHEDLEKAEKETFKEFQKQLADAADALRNNNALISEIDVLLGFAELAQQLRWVQPTMNDSRAFTIKAGRHPSVERALSKSLQAFTSNDAHLDEASRIRVIVGPNMGGKSTYLRQNAIIAILAQGGSFVPADHAEIGLVDRIFSRIGASDDLAQGKSTFMVEMSESAEILKGATERSLVIMDEVGRGTTSSDGLAIAFAILKHLLSINRSRTLFATHFHQLADMLGHGSPAGLAEGVEFFCTDIEEAEDGSFSFTHTIRPGITRDSHGLRIAQLAGVPPEVMRVARSALEAIRERDGAEKAWSSEEVGRLKDATDLHRT